MLSSILTLNVSPSHYELRAFMSVTEGCIYYSKDPEIMGLGFYGVGEDHIIDWHETEGL